MLKVVGRSDHFHGAVLDNVVLPYALRQKGRFRTASQSGLDVGVFLPRGDVLKHGDYLHTECGQVLVVVAEKEAVVTAKTDDWETFAKACYHMGNRHVPMAIGQCWLRFQPDHVLQEMVEMMGLVCEAQMAEFTPENGAYHGSGKGHHHGHEHDHSHEHEQHDHDYGDSHGDSHSHGHSNNHLHTESHNKSHGEHHH
ncbi:urease accessory protein UreE [Vibrio sp. C8]